MTMCTVEANPSEDIVRDHAGALLASNVQTYISIKSAYDQCEPEIKAVVDDMIALCNDPECSPDERNAALNTVVEALFPMITADYLESAAKLHKRDEKGRDAATNSELVFAGRVEHIMQQKGMTQEQLAEKAGVGQPAISNMLKRQCRPQQKTIRRIAEALGVSPEELWPQQE